MGVRGCLLSGRWASESALASSNPTASAALQGCGRRQSCPKPAGPRVSRPGPTHHDFGEDIPGVLTFSLQPQRAQSLLQPRRRARPGGPLRASWGGPPARGDAVGDWGAPRLGIEVGSWTLQGRGGGVRAWRKAQARRWEPGSCISPASFRLESRAKPNSRLFPLELRTRGGRFKCAWAHAR